VPDTYSTQLCKDESNLIASKPCKDFIMLKFSLFSSLVFFLFSSIGAAQKSQLPSFFEASNKFLNQHVVDGLVDYSGIKSAGTLTPIVNQIANIEIENLHPLERKAYLINAYNLLVIDQIIDNYPVASVIDINNFFDAKKVTIAGKDISLNTLEKEYLIKEYGDPRLHFVLVCGALDCPPIVNKAYVPSTLEDQLNQQTKLAVDDPGFLRISTSGVELSNIFNWYAADFGGNKKDVLVFINKYKSAPIDLSTKVKYYDYDWTINERIKGPNSLKSSSLNLNTFQGSSGSLPSAGSNANDFRYVVSSTVAKGTNEVKVFNNLYSQDAAGERASFNTTSLSALYGLTDRINIGIAGRYRRVRYDESGNANNLSVLGSPNENSVFRQGITGLGPRIRIAPFKKLSNFSIESQYLFSMQDDASGARDGQRFIDFDGDTWITQFFNDFALGSRFSIFTEVDFIIEDIGGGNQTSTPITGIFSFFPNPKTTIYALGSYSPFYQTDFNYFTQVGAGAKYQITPKFEVEVLATSFSNTFISDVGGSATTVNLGLRFNL